MENQLKIICKEIVLELKLDMDSDHISCSMQVLDMFVLIMQQDSRQLNDEKVEAKAKCTIDHFVFKRVKADRWVDKCLTVEEI